MHIVNFFVYFLITFLPVIVSSWAILFSWTLSCTSACFRACFLVRVLVFFLACFLFFFYKFPAQIREAILKNQAFKLYLMEGDIENPQIIITRSSVPSVLCHHFIWHTKNVRSGFRNRNVMRKGRT